MAFIRNFMIKDVVSVRPDTPLLEATNTMLKGGFTGVPVVDEKNAVVGILTEYDLLTKGSSLHLPTFLKLIKEFDVYKKDESLISEDLKKILNLKVLDLMNDDPLTLNPNMPIEEAAKVFAEHHKVNPILIVDENKKLIGVLSRFDVIKFYGGTAPVHPAHEKGAPYLADRAVKDFLVNFEKNFVAVSRYRTKYWFLISLAFLVVGIIATTIFILRVEIDF